MIFLSLYGREVFWIIAIILLFIIGGSSGKKTAIIISLAIIVLIPIGVIAKQVIERPRPTIPVNDFLIPADSEFSYPSGHALIVSAAAAVALAVFRDSTKKLTLSLIFAVEAALVCVSRVYVGGHYPLDVVGGILLGVGVSFIFLWKEKEIESGLQKIVARIKR
jgi:undecaprenyl-diphosphatase